MGSAKRRPASDQECNSDRRICMSFGVSCWLSLVRCVVCVVVLVVFSSYWPVLFSMLLLGHRDSYSGFLIFSISVN
jgi:hypothetical protein